MPPRKSSETAKAQQLSYPGIQHEEGDLSDSWLATKQGKTNLIHLAERMQTVNAIQWRSHTHRDDVVVRQIWGTNAFADVAHTTRANATHHRTKKARTAVTGKLADRDKQNVGI